MLETLGAVAEKLLRLPQCDLSTEHLLHGGLYTRTLRMPADCVLVGAQIKVPTTLIVQGDALVFAGDAWVRLSGYNVLAGEAGRKQMFVAISEVVLTMVFPTTAQTVDEAERELTDEFEQLMTRQGARGESLCLVE